MEKRAYFFSKKSLKILDELRDKGRVHSIFNTSINIITSKGTLITLLSKEKEIYRNPISIIIDEKNFEKWKISLQEEVIYENNILRFLESGIQVDTKNKITWDASFRFFGPLNSPSSISKNLDTLKFFISVMKWKKGMLPLVIEDMPDTPYTSKARKIFAKIDKEKLNGLLVLKELIGLGEGLTPGGDDFLSGMLVVLYYFGKYLNMENEVDNFTDKFLQDVNQKTNFISATFLKLAARGEALFLLREIIKDLLGRRGFDMENIRALIEYGGTSGASLLAGVIFGIDYVLRYLYSEIKEVIV